MAERVDYNKLTNKPRIEGVELEGNVRMAELGFDKRDYYTKGEVNGIITNLSNAVNFSAGSSGGGGGEGGTTNYNQLSNKPKINGVALQGDKTAKQLGIDLELYYTKTEADAKFSGGGGGATTEDITAKGSSLFPDGTVIPEGTTLTEFIKMLAIKRVAATYTAPTVKLALSPTTFERGVATQITATGTFTKNDAGAKTSETTTPDPATKITNTTVFTYTVAYGEGATKNDNLGEPSPDGHITAGSVKATATATAYDPYYHGVGAFDFDAKNGTKEVAPKASKAYTFTTANETSFIASPYEIRSIIDQNNFDVTSSFTHASGTYTRADNTTITYHVYTSPKATATNFKYTFNFK